MVTAGALAIAVVVAGAPAPAQAPDPPSVSLGVPVAPRLAAYVTCDGVRHVATVVDGFVVVSRDSDGPATIEVGVSFSGDLADDLIDPVSSISAAAEARYSAIPFVLPADAVGSLTVALEPGADHELGDPSSGTVEVTGEAETVEDCTIPLELDPGTADQTISPGQQPADLGVHPGDEQGLRVAGALPPGLTLDRGVWSGTATTPGTYAFQVQLCEASLVVDQGDLPNTLCIGSADVRIVVSGGATPPPPPATAATPVAAAARLTG
ncbi:MAG TPA: hypothetical protein VF228_13415 [Iamia sp.]